MTFSKLLLTDTASLKEMSELATKIVREHFDPIIGTAQNDYMLQKFQTVEAIKEQISHGSQYYFVLNNNRKIGFLAFYPKGSVMYISKFYLLREERGKGYSRLMLDFIIQKTREIGLSSIELNVNRNNSAIFAYEKLGFHIIRTELNDIGEGFFMDDYVYYLNISD